ncbi:MAG: type 2 isopentenyl-diphosphate Delta-isomerase [Methanomicrobiales archaeon]|nr:type 2 isopentenyl-diphosphate Delta-isomerase [Methanomicrobiales archaeon]
MTARLTSRRKLDHLRICCEEDVECGDPGFDDVLLIHRALPECDMDGITLRTRFLNGCFESPLFIAGMTGGHREAKEVNRRLAIAAEKFGIGMGVGSQRAALEDPSLEGTFSIVREVAPHAFLCANLGIVQLRDRGIEWAERAVEMIDAQALVIHLNFLQEAIQPEGDHRATGCLDALRELCRSFRRPVIVKETGAGIDGGTARTILSAGAGAIDIGGTGGTSWAAVETIRAGKKGVEGEIFNGWGIPTVLSLCEVARTGAPVIATGGVRNGLHIAKCIALGASMAGMALPLLRAAMAGEEALMSTVERIHRELRIAMFLTGSCSIYELKHARTIVTGRTREMVELFMEERDGY